MKSAPPVQEKDVLVEEPRPAATRRVANVVRALPYLLTALVVSVPLMFAWGSFLVYYDNAREAFGDGRVIDGVVNLLLVALLVVFVSCVTLTFVLASKSLGAAAWRWTEGRPTLRAGLSSARFGLASVAAIAAVVGLLTWLPSNEATSDSRTLKESLEEAGSRAATLLAADGEPAQAATEAPAEPDGPQNLEPEEPPTEPRAEPLAEPRVEAPAKPVVTARREEERGSDPALSRPAPNERNEGTATVDAAPLETVDPIPDEVAFALDEPVFDVEPVAAEETATLPIEPAATPELTAPPVPPEGHAPPKDDASLEKPPDVWAEAPAGRPPPESSSREVPEGFSPDPKNSPSS